MAAFLMICLMLVAFNPAMINALYLDHVPFPDEKLKYEDEDLTVEMLDDGEFHAAVDDIDFSAGDFPKSQRTATFRSFQETLAVLNIFPDIQTTAAVDTDFEKDDAINSCTDVVMLTDKSNTCILVFDTFNKVMYISYPNSPAEYVSKLIDVIMAVEKNEYFSDVSVTFDLTTEKMFIQDPLFSDLPFNVVDAMTRFLEDFRKLQATAVDKTIDVPFVDVYMGSYGCGVGHFYNATYYFVTCNSSVKVFPELHCGGFSSLIKIILINGILLACIFFMIYRFFMKGKSDDDHPESECDKDVHISFQFDQSAD